MTASCPSLMEFQVGWICALPIEAAAAKEMLDENFGILEEQDMADPNSYTLGRIGKHHVVIACLPDGQYATTSATTVANNMLRTFSTSLRIGLMVGIAGGIPSDDHDIRLGDIVVSRPEGSYGGVIQYDKGKIAKNGRLIRVGPLNSPPRSLLMALGNMKAALLTEDPEYPQYIEKAIGRNRKTQKLFTRPELKSDRLFKTEYDHPSSAKTCDGCLVEWEVIRGKREDFDSDPQTHYGTIASGNSVVKDGITRDQIREETGALCFEMEAAGLMQDFPCIVIRGICDYSDSHKSKQWQGYAALVAASYAKELLTYVPRGQVPQERLAAELTNVCGEIKELKQDLVGLSQKFSLNGLIVAPGALYDSYENIHDECLPGTRTELLKEIEKWARTPDQQCIFWLQGMAGTGKSTISRTVASRLKQANCLGATFFFKRGEADRGNAKRLFPTLADQLVRSIPQLLPQVQKTISEDPQICEKALREQFMKLILEPLSSIKSDATTILVIIDALDECDRDDDIRVLLWLLPQIKRSNSIQIRFFLTSRPEGHIKQGFQQIPNDRQDFILHDIPAPVIRNDITLYFQHQFTKMKEEEERKLPSDWPGDDILKILIERAIPLFISAVTLCRFLRDKNWNPAARLRIILSDQTSYVSKMASTYMPVLSQLLHGQDQDESQFLIQDFKEIVGVIVVLAAPLSVNALSRLLNRETGDVACRLNHLHSVLDIPADPEKPTRSLHQSFADFLLDRKQKECNPFWVHGQDVHQKLVTHCLEAMTCLRQNICNLESYATPRTEIDAESIYKHLSPETQYSCRYWVHHLVQCADVSGLLHDVLGFLRSQFLHWLEAMSLLGFAFEVARMLNFAETVVPSDRYRIVADFLRDAKRFVLRNGHMVDETPLQLYCAALVFAPQTAIIRREFETEIPSWVYRLPQTEVVWNAEILFRPAHSQYVASVAFSLDDQMIASGSYDKKVRLWNTLTGHLIQTLEGHSDRVESVFFSPDGRMLASGSYDKTILLWDLTTGIIQRTIATSESVRSVSISPDSRQVASNSGEIVQIWDITTGEVWQTLEGHSNEVNSVTFSPNGKLLASGSLDCTVRLWDPVQGVLHRALDSSSPVYSVAFSPDSKLLASGGKDHVARIWDTATGVLLQSICHPESVRLVVFLANSSLLACGLLSTVRLCDTTSGVLQQTLDHPSRVWSVASSHDGQKIATGGDMVLHLWDPAAGEPQREPENNPHTGNLQLVRSVAFSSDGKILASISDDATVRLWDTTTGEVQRILTSAGEVKRVMTSSGDINSIALSPDGQLLACCSRGRKVRVWNTATGEMRHSLEDTESPATSFWSVAFSPDGWMLATGRSCQEIIIWDPVTGAIRQRLRPGEFQGGHTDPVVFSPDSRLLASFSLPCICLWDLETGLIQQKVDVNRSISYLQFSPDGLSIITNQGSWDVQSGQTNHAASCLVHPDKGFFFREDQWIKLNEKNVLRIPVESQPCCFAAHDNLFAVGHLSGRISFIGLSTP